MSSKNAEELEAERRWQETEESGALDELEDAEELEAERRWEETEEEPQTPEWITEGSETPAIAETGGEVAVDDEAAVDEQLFEFEDDADPLAEELVPKVSDSELRARIDEYFNLANASHQGNVPREGEILETVALDFESIATQHD
jgi:hypothetical protein